MTEKTLEELLSTLSDAERQQLIKSLGGVDTTSVRKHRHHFPKTHARFGYISDSHIGHKQFKERLFSLAMTTFKREGIDTCYHAGDILEGMSGREGHIYELDHIGFNAQIEYASELISAFPEVQIYGIEGNHDLWYQSKNNAGVMVGTELENRVKNYHHLGQMEADIELSPSIILKLYHANDGSAYAASYKIQKLIESFTGGRKPNIVISGHYHKHLTLWSRNIFGVEAGTLCDQTNFMRGKKLAAHMGFGIMDVWYNKNGITRIDHSFIPFFEDKEARK
jgi:predicted phosphodiesterase